MYDLYGNGRKVASSLLKDPIASYWAFKILFTTGITGKHSMATVSTVCFVTP